MADTRQNNTGHLAGNLLIGFAEERGTHGEVQAVNPRTGHALRPTYGLGGDEHVERAAILAWKAFPAFRETSLISRASFLEQIAANIESLGDSLIERIVAETGIPAARAEAERTRTLGQLRLFAKVVREGSWIGVRIDEAMPERAPLPRPDIRQRAIPLGPVAVFAASNFPLAFSVAGGDTASAFAAGAPVIVKAHSAHPGTSELVGRSIQRAARQHGLPEGTFSMLYGEGESLGTALATHPRIKAVAFTGSRTAGLALRDAAAARREPIPVYAEMASVNPVFILPNALESRGEELGREYITSVTTGAGQLCTSPGLVFVFESPGVKSFIDSASSMVRKSAASPMLTLDIQESYARRVEELAAAEGSTLLAAGNTNLSGGTSAEPVLFETHADAFIDNPTLHQEVFGAASLVVRIRDMDQLMHVIEVLEGQLTATLQADESDYATAQMLMLQLEPKVGRIVFNGWPTGVEVCHSMVHGGPFPATSDSRATSVGTRAIERFLRPVAYQNVPDPLLPAAIDIENTLGVPRCVDGCLNRSTE